MTTVKDVHAAYKGMSQADKAALQALKAEEESRVSRPLSIGDILRAVTPGLEQPEYLN